MTQIHPGAVEDFKNEYSLEFLGLSQDHSEADLRAALLRNLAGSSPSSVATSASSAPSTRFKWASRTSR